MPQQKGTHLEPENAEDNFHFHFTLWGCVSLVFPQLHTNDSVDEKKDTWSGGRSDRYPAGFGNTRGQSAGRLIGAKPKITCSQSWHLWPRHWHGTWRDWRNINKCRRYYWIFSSSVFWVLSILLCGFTLTSSALLVYCACLNCCEIVVCFCVSCREENTYLCYILL